MRRLILRPIRTSTVLLLLVGSSAGAALCGCAGSLRQVLDEDRVERLKRDVAKVRFAISTTKNLIAKARGARYLPDLHMRLAELYIEQAKYHYHIAYEKQKGKGIGVVSVQTRLLKNQAIATYRRLVAIYPDYRDADKVLFFMAHELRELGEYEEMLKTYLDLADKHPTSKYRLEGLLVVGDYYFDKAELDQAEKYYQLVLDSPETRVHAMARYKMAWCKINRADFKAALKLLEGSVAAARKWLAMEGARSSAENKIDLRREALVDSVFCYTEVHKPKGALEYFKERADSKTTYLAALDKLGNRYYIKQNWKPTAQIYREILGLTGDTEDALEYAHRLYEAVTQGKVYDHGADDVAAVVKVITRRYYNHTLKAEERKKLLDTFEKYARDMATKLHDLANENKEEKLFLEAARAYEAYLAFFDASSQAGLVLANLAEALYSAKRYLEAGRSYERAAEKQQGKERQDAIYTAVVSYFAALTEAAQQLSRLDVVQGRAGLRRAGELFIRSYAKDSKIGQVKFNIARTYYDAGEFHEAIRYFTALVDQFPTTKEGPVAAHLVMDAYRSMEDYEGLIETGKKFAAMPRLGDNEFKREVAEIVSGAENRLLDSETLKAAGDEEGPGADRLVEIAQKHTGTELGEKALVNAFVTARSSNDPEKIFEVGDKLIRAYPNSDKLPDVLSTMGKLALDSLQFARGAAYLEAAGRRKNNQEASDLLKAACTIYAGLGDRDKAESSLNTFMRLAGSAEDKAALAIDVARLHTQASDWGGAIRLLQGANAAGAASTEMLYLLGYALFRRGELADAENYLSQAASAGRSGTDDDGEAAAAAQFYLGEIAFKTFESIQLSSDLSQLGPILQQKIAYMTQTREAYKAVVGMGSAVWSVASLGRLSSVDAAAAEALRSLALPDGLPPEIVQQVRGALETNAAPLAKEAKEALGQCAQTSRKLKVLSEAARDCLAGRAPSGDPLASIKVPTVSRAAPEGAAKLERHLARNSKDVAAITKLGELHLAVGNPYMAQLVVGKGLEFQETAQLLNLSGVATARLGEHQAALELFERAIKKGGAKTAHANKAALLGRYGYTKESQAELKKVRGDSLDDQDPRLIPSWRQWAGGAP